MPFLKLRADTVLICWQIEWQDVIVLKKIIVSRFAPGLNFPKLHITQVRSWNKMLFYVNVSRNIVPLIYNI